MDERAIGGRRARTGVAGATIHSWATESGEVRRLDDKELSRYEETARRTLSPRRRCWKLLITTETTEKNIEWEKIWSRHR